MMNKFKRARLIEGLTQTELAAKLGVSAVSVHKWEAGESFPNVKRLRQISEILHVSVEEFVSDERRTG